MYKFILMQNFLLNIFIFYIIYYLNENYFCWGEFRVITLIHDNLLMQKTMTLITNLQA
jgi:hypothetical protein